MNIPITDENRKAVISIQKDWIEFIRTGKMKDRTLLMKQEKLRNMIKILELYRFRMHILFITFRIAALPISYEKNISATVDNQHTPAQSIDEEHQWLNPPSK